MGNVVNKIRQLRNQPGTAQNYNGKVVNVQQRHVEASGSNRPAQPGNVQMWEQPNQSNRNNVSTTNGIAKGYSGKVGNQPANTVGNGNKGVSNCWNVGIKRWQRTGPGNK